MAAVQVNICIWKSAFSHSSDYKAAAPADQGSFPGLPQRRHTNRGWWGFYQRCAELQWGTDKQPEPIYHFPLSGLYLRDYIWLWFETRNNKIWLLKSKNASPPAAPCQTADIQTRARALKWWLKLVACSDYESEQMADTAIFSSLTISLPSVIVTLSQVQKEVCVWVCLWMKLDDDWIHGGRKKPIYYSVSVCNLWERE